MKIPVTGPRLLLLALAVITIAVVALRTVPFSERVERLLWRYSGGAVLGSARVDRNIMITASDGVSLATDIYRPARASSELPTLMIRLPYGKAEYGEVHHYAQLFVSHGYAVVVQDMRGRFGSTGVFQPYRDDAQDAVATLDWITAQPWSNGRVGTIGCSALGETQIILAAERHPAHAAMIPIGAGGAIGSLGNSHGYFAFFEGGILNLSSAFGWFARWGGKTGERMGGPDIDYAAAVQGLPVISLVGQHRDDPTDYEALIENFANDAVMRAWGYIDQTDRFATPGLMIDTWYDTAISSSIRLSSHMRQTAPDQHLIIAPGTHCQFHGAWGQVGDMPYGPEAARDYDELFVAYFDHWLKNAPPPDLPPFTYYMLGADRWLEANHWPPEYSQPMALTLSSDTEYAHSGRLLTPEEEPSEGIVHYISDPDDPVPSIGGATCCTNDPGTIEGPAWQDMIEGRPDVVTFTSAPLEQPLRIAGPVSAVLHVSSDAPDADIIARISDVSPEGRSLLIQEGALRLRYRDSFTEPALMEPWLPVEARIPMRDIAYQIPAGHRLRLAIASSNFPRLERNLQTGGRNFDETQGQRAEIRIHTGTATPSRLLLFVLAED